jgi:hypothetical protein
MSGQSATLSLKEAKAMQTRIVAFNSVDKNQGPTNPSATAELCKKIPHQGK